MMRASCAPQKWKFEMTASYAIGIDLGTTHTAISYVDLDLSEGESVALHVQDIVQHTGPGALESKKLLPSFLYLPHPGELPEGSLTLPWKAHEPRTIGELARSLGSKTPDASRVECEELAWSWWCGQARCDPPRQDDARGRRCAAHLAAGSFDGLPAPRA